MIKSNTPLSCILFLLLVHMLTFGTAKAQSHLLQNPVVEEVARGYQFLEGPVWIDSLGVLFSDIPANAIYRYSPVTDSVSIYKTPSGNSNGLILDLDSNLLLAQHGNRRIVRIKNGVEDSVVERYQGKRLNSPNDIAVKSSRTIFFTDPPYGITAAEEELGFYGIYSVTPNGKLHLLDASLFRPNGIALSPDESKLYVSNTLERTIYQWDILNDSTIGNKSLLTTVTLPGNMDGMTVDRQGIIYATGPTGIWVVGPNGVKLDTIPIPGQATNCTFGDPDRGTLYVTSGGSLYRVRSQIVVSGWSPTYSVSKKSPLGINYPNPVLFSTAIPVTMEKEGKVRLEIRNTQGKLVQLLTEKRLGRGEHHFEWQPRNISDGLYYIQLNVEGEVYAVPCLVKGN